MTKGIQEPSFLSTFLDCGHVVKWEHQGKPHTGMYEASNFDSKDDCWWKEQWKMRKLYTRAKLIRLQINFINPHQHSTPSRTEERMWIYVLPAVWGQRLGVGPAPALLSGLTPVPGYIIVVIRTVVPLWLPGSTTVSIGTLFIAIHCPGAGHIFQDFMVFVIGWLGWGGSLVRQGCGGRGRGGGGGGMLGHLISMRDEEVLHTVHGGICLCWCFTFVSVLRWLMFSGE